MNSNIIVGMLSLIGTLAGTMGGIMTANKLTSYRIGELEKKVEKHNSIIERTFRLEDKVQELEKDIIELKEKK